MTAEIAVPDKELEDLMAQLEMETGVAVAPSPAPVVAAKPSVALSEDDELLAALGEDPAPAAVSVGLFVGQIVGVEPHPASAAVGIAQVNIGSHTIQVACRADRGLEIGKMVAVGTPGLVFNGIEVKATDLRGTASDGQIFSGKELGISEEVKNYEPQGGVVGALLTAESLKSLPWEDNSLAELEAELAAGEATATITTETTARAEADAALSTAVTGAATTISPEDELAALEAELAGVTLAAPVEAVGKPTQTAGKVLEIVQETSDSEERGLSFIPGEVLHDPETAPKPVAAIATAETEVSLNLNPAPGAGGLQFFTDPAKFTVNTRISDTDLDTCLIEQNSLRSTYGVAAAKAEQQAARVKVKFEILEATLYEEQRRLAAEEGEKVTEKALENRVKSDPRWGKGKMLVIDAAGIADVNRALVESLRDRKDMLVQLGADRRDEMKGQARVMANASANAELALRAQNAVKGQQ